MSESRRFSPSEVNDFYDDVDFLGERPVGVPGEVRVASRDTLLSSEHVISEVTDGDAGRVSRVLSKAGKVVFAVRGGAREVRLFVGEHPLEIAAGVGAAIAVGVFVHDLFDRHEHDSEQ
jgi:predicted RNA-binding protein YlqC (UPF0109 family)